MSKFSKDYLMLKILNNDKFTTAQNRHFLVSLKIPILNSLPERAKVKANRSPVLLPLQGVGVYALIPRALPCSELAALSGRSRRRFELIEFLQRGCGLRRSSLVGLRRRNNELNELNELTNCRAARVRGIAPVRGSYFRIGARPYLLPVLIGSRFCPCKGRVSLAGLAPQ